ncbi:MAG: hypothetical protein IPK19_29120 [Chloroflexi bacterium]|nr:hypothetical protein [Chloroflexota bacterium]
MARTDLRKWDGALLIVSHDRYSRLGRWYDLGDERHRYRRLHPLATTAPICASVRNGWERAERVYEQEMERLRAELDFIKRNIARAPTNAGGRRQLAPSQS